MFPRSLTRACLLAAACLMSAPALADAVAGMPLMRHYSAKDTQAPPGTLALATGVDGAMFAGNAEGVLRYDGLDWRLTELPGRSMARSLATGKDGLVYVGGYDTFGHLARHSDGKYHYEELLTRAGLREAKRHVGVVWDVLPTDEGVYFHAEQALHFVPYGRGDAKQWPLPAEVRSFSVADGRLYARVQGRGFCRFQDGKFTLEPGGEKFKDQALAGLVDHGTWRLLVGRRGLFRADAKGITRLPGKAGKLLAGANSYVVRALDDGSFAVGTLDGELFRVGSDYSLRESLTLGGFSVQALALDREGGLWAGTEGDLVRLSLPSPWSFLGEAQGLAGSPTDFEWHDGSLWLASSRGLSRLVPGPGGGLKSQRLPWAELEVNALHSTAAGLLIGRREGLDTLDPGSAEPRSLFRHPSHGVFSLQASRFVPGLVLGITESELVLVRERAGRWQLVSRIPLDGISVWGLEEFADGELWMGNSRGALQRWRVDLETGEVLERESFDDASGLAVDAASGTHAYQLDGRIHAVSGQRGFRREGDRFVADNAPPVSLVQRPHELTVQETALGAYAYTTRQLWHRANNAQEWRQVHPGSDVAAGYTYLRVGSDGVLRIATWTGVLQYDPRETAPEPQPLTLRIDSVRARSQANETALALATESESQSVSVPAGHSLDLRFAMVSMESGAEFRYFLHGVTPEWSQWDNRDLFIRALPAGRYELEVQARTRNGREPAAIRYRFEVQPHWYQQWWLLALAVFALAALAVAATLWAVRLRTERYLAANLRLEARIAERTRELEEVNRQLAELATEDALTGIANRRALENGLRRVWYRCLDQRRPLSVLMIDVDNFKAYNDAHGHLEGDVQLRGIAQRLNQLHDPQRELLARYGGEEFALLMPGVHQAEALRRAEAIRAAVAGSDAGMTVSIGVAGFVPDVQVEPETLLRRADAALYEAKRAGRNRVRADRG